MQVVYGILAMGSFPEGVEPNEHGHVEDYQTSDMDSTWYDFALMKHDGGKYYFEFETMLGWETKEGCRDWIVHCLNCLTEYMDKHGYDKTKELSMYRVFTEGVDVNAEFDSIEEAYAWLKMMVFGFHGQGLFLELIKEDNNE